jgi:DNA-directed RNA polymerase subunit beta'
MFQRRVLANTLDVVGRAAITPDPTLDMDHVGLPESKAWTIYRPFILRRLARRYNAGDQRVPMTDLAKWIQSKDPRARQAMMEEIGSRPVLINRAPVWHRYGYMAAWPTLVPGETLRISPITTPGFGADFDGDAMNYTVPVSDDAVT